MKPDASFLFNGGSKPNGYNTRHHVPCFPFIIGVAGGSSSGKSEVCERIVEALGQNGKSAKERQVYVINQDSFYRDLNVDEMNKAEKFDFNFDHPTSVEFEKLKECLRKIKKDESVLVPQYNYLKNVMCKDETTCLSIHSADIIIVEGILVFYDKELRELFDLKLFVDADSDTRLARRVVRDTEARGRDLDSVLSQYIRYVKPAFEEFCLPTKKYADIIIPRGNDNEVAVSLIVQHIQDLLQCNANSRRSSVGPDSLSRSSGSSRTSSIPGSPLNRSSDQINISNKLCQPSNNSSSNSTSVLNPSRKKNTNNMVNSLQRAQIGHACMSQLTDGIACKKLSNTSVALTNSASVNTSNSLH